MTTMAGSPQAGLETRCTYKTEYLWRDRSRWFNFLGIHLTSHGQQEERNCPAGQHQHPGALGGNAQFQRSNCCRCLSRLVWPLQTRGQPLPEDEDRGGPGPSAFCTVSSEKSCTLAIIKPDAVAHGKTDEIIMKIQEAGFDILTNEERTMRETEVRLFYQHRAGEEAFEKLVHHMCSGPSHLLILTRSEGTEDVFTTWQTLMGPCDPDVARREQPDSLRAQYGTEMPLNAVHGSRDREDASRELALLFPSFKFSDQVPEAPQGHEAEGAMCPTQEVRFLEDADGNGGAAFQSM
ncbi:thioredoxin domain-containing protein 6 isoform 4-T4 [Hipposideros larvatus]